MIAMALMCGAALILADEPTTALDVTIQAQILAPAGRVAARIAMGLVLITTTSASSPASPRASW